VDKFKHFLIMYSSPRRIGYSLYQNENYIQSLLIKITVPRGCTLKTLPLFLNPGQVEIVNCLSQLLSPSSRPFTCKLVKREFVPHNKEVWTIKYVGPYIYNTEKKQVMILGHLVDPGKEIEIIVLKSGR